MIKIISIQTFCAYPLSSFIYTTPHLSDRQKHANARLEAFILQTIIEAQESTDAPDTDSTGSNWETDLEKEDNHSSTLSDWGMGIEEDESPVSDMVIEACHERRSL